MKNSVLVTITGLAHYYGTKPFKVGAVIKLKKEYDNKYDDEAIRAQLPYIGTVGYVANSTYTVYSGTYSAGRLYDKIGECACAKIILITHLLCILPRTLAFHPFYPAWRAGRLV